MCQSNASQTGPRIWQKIGMHIQIYICNCKFRPCFSLILNEPRHHSPLLHLKSPQSHGNNRHSSQNSQQFTNRRPSIYSQTVKLGSARRKIIGNRLIGKSKHWCTAIQQHLCVWCIGIVYIQLHRPMIRRKCIIGCFNLYLYNKNQRKNKRYSAWLCSIRCKQ